MSPTLHWMGGWASNFHCWELLLQEEYSGYNHRFLDTHEFLNHDFAHTGLDSLPGKHVVVAWSMGSLLCHLWIERGQWPLNLPLLSLCPVFQFSQGGFAKPILLKMGKKLSQDRKEVLRDFWRQMPKAETITPIHEQLWLEGTETYSTESLIQGLKFLAETHVNPHSLSVLPHRWELMVGDQDRLSPTGAWELTLIEKGLLHALVHYPGGHLPFFDHPKLVSHSLQQLLINSQNL